MLELHMFGGICLSEEGSWDPHPLLSHPKCLALLGFLAAARPRGCHRRDKLLALLWPESDEKHARGSLRKTLFLIRKEVGDDSLQGCGCEDVGVNFEEVWCDVVAFRSAIEEGELERALKHYGGEFLDGFHLGDWPFDEWVAEERRKLQAMAAKAGWEMAAEEEGRGRGMSAARWARWAADLTPLNEMAHQRLLRTLDRLGDRAGALREHREFSRRLESELDLVPGPETLALLAEIRDQSRARVTQPRNGRAGSDRNGKSSLAVLPFVSLTDDSESQEFADGLHQEVILQLQARKSLRVTPWATVVAYGGFPRDLHGVAAELGVGAVLEGSVRSWNGRVRIALDLVGGEDQGSLWCHVLERDLADRSSLQAGVAREVARGVQDCLATC